MYYKHVFLFLWDSEVVVLESQEIINMFCILMLVKALNVNHFKTCCTYFNYNRLK